MTGLASASYAQQGSVLVFGTFSVNTEKDADDNKATSFSIFPGIGYQFTKNWTVGVTGGYARTKYDPVIGSDVKSNNYAIGVFGRYTCPISDIFSMYGQADVTYRGGESGAFEYTGFGASIIPAVAINFKNGCALNFGFGGIEFESQKLEGASESSTAFGISLGQQFNIGVSKNFGGTKTKK